MPPGVALTKAPANVCGSCHHARPTLVGTSLPAVVLTKIWVMRWQWTIGRANATRSSLGKRIEAPPPHSMIEVEVSPMQHEHLARSTNVLRLLVLTFALFFPLRSMSAEDAGYVSGNKVTDEKAATGQTHPTPPSRAPGARNADIEHELKMQPAAAPQLNGRPQ